MTLTVQLLGALIVGDAVLHPFDLWLPSPGKEPTLHGSVHPNAPERTLPSMETECAQDTFQRLADELLVCLVADRACQAAAHALVLRHQSWIEAWVANQGAALRLSVQDIEDATQRAMIA